MSERKRKGTKKTLAIIGGCVRALVQSARRAGYDCVGFDRFGDWDASIACQMIQVTNWLEILEHPLAGRITDWILAGGLEQSPEIVQLLDQRWDRIGIVWEGLERSCDPGMLSEAARRYGIRMPEWQYSPPVDSNGWLRKPIVGSGGVGVDWATSPIPPEMEGVRWIYQRFVPGHPISILYLTMERATHLVGVCFQRLGQAAPDSSSPFGFVGAIGPVELTGSTKNLIEGLGCELSSILEVKGLWGIDAVWNETGLHLIEVNPRPTATVDMYELAGIADSLVGQHVRAETLDRGHFQFEPVRRRIAKQVVFWGGPEPLTVSEELHRWLVRNRNSHAKQWVADIPWPGTTIGPSEPFLTAYIELPQGELGLGVGACLSGEASLADDRALAPATRQLERWIETIRETAIRIGSLT